jgi:protocatechuate 3,4-dioxygenase beta subunit
MAGIGAGLAAGAAGTASAAVAATGAAGAGTGASTGIAAVMSTVTAKVIVAAAVVIVTVGAVFTYRHLNQPEQPSVQNDEIAILQTEQEPIVTPEITETILPDVQDAAANPVEVPEIQAAPVSTNVGTTHIAQIEPASTSGNAGIIEDSEYIFHFKGVLSGLVTDIQTGEPVTDAKLYMSHVNGGRIYESKTDENGFYSFNDIDVDGNYGIQLFSKTNIGIHDRDKATIHLQKEKQKAKHFDLPRACMIKVKVVDEQSQPVSGAYFINTLLADDEKRNIGDRMGRDETDTNGMILLGGFKPKETPYLIVAGHRVKGDFVQKNGMRYYETHRDFAPAKLEVVLNDPNTVEYKEIVLHKGISIEGRIQYADGEPAADLTVSAYPQWWHSHYCPESYPVDSEGHFTLKHILPDAYDVHASVPMSNGMSRGCSLGQREFPLGEGELLALTFPGNSPNALASISGSVKWLGDGEPQYVHINVRDSQNMSSFESLSRNTEGQLDKTFLIERLNPGLYTLEFSGDGIETTTIRNIKAPCEGLVVELTTKQDIILRGRVLDKYDEKPITKFEMHTGNGDWVQFENTEGNFELTSKDLKYKRLWVRAKGYTTVISEEICPDANELTIINLGIGGAIEGRVLDEQGNPINVATISHRYGTGNKDITKTDTNGLFVIEDIPEDVSGEWFVISHPDYAPQTKQIIVEEDYITEVEIVLKKGTAVEGHVYDTKGKPVAGETLYFLDGTTYHYWKENRARLGSVTTDPNGYYRITNMPEKLCHGFRHEPDEQLGTVQTAILPVTGKTRRLDFGGQWKTTGRLLLNGQPMPHINMTIRGNIIGYETTFKAHAVTDAQGRFTFWGIPSGQRYVYWSIPGVRGRQKWSEMGRFNFESGVDFDLGDFELNLADLVIDILAENPNESLDQLDVSLQRYDEQMFHGPKAGQLKTRNEATDPYVFSNLAPGKYELIAQRTGYPSTHKVIEVLQGQTTCNTELLIPSGSASLSGKVIYPVSEKYPRPLRLRSVNQEITAIIQPGADRNYEIKNLPAGQYIFGYTSVALSRQSNIKELKLKEGENKKLDIEVDDIGRNHGGYLIVVVVTEEGLPLTGTNVWLEKDGDDIMPHFNSGKGQSFSGDAGEYTLHAEYPGYREIQQKVNIKSKEGLTTQEILKPLVITMIGEPNEDLL